MDKIVSDKRGSTRIRWDCATRDHALDTIRKLPLLETNSEQILDAISAGTVATNVYLRRLHNYALGMNWIAWPIVPRKLWPKVQYRDKRAITLEEHCRIIERERNPERRAFYEFAWRLGASQSDLANLQAEDVDWGHRVVNAACVVVRLPFSPHDCAPHIPHGATRTR